MFEVTIIILSGNQSPHIFPSQHIAIQSRILVIFEQDGQYFQVGQSQLHRHPIICFNTIPAEIQSLISQPMKKLKRIIPKTKT